MTKREAAVISAYTGVLLCEFEVVHEYIYETRKDENRCIRTR